MRRLTATVDRTSTAVLGAALIAVGGGAVAWEQGRFPGRERVEASFVDDIVSAGWWPWALGAAAVVLILLGLRWLLAHLPKRSIGSVALDTSNADGTLTVDLGTAARSAAHSLGARPGIVSASGRSVSDRGERIVEISATLDPRVTTLSAVSDAAAETRRDLIAALEGTPASVRILLQCGRTKKQSARVN